ncbi:hypothetical protein HYU15_04075 [Candidatus Woesearchaeota archaeon]|nr:hypothetical protein [Candidatus Woesearchaeota archaeon]
MALGVILTVLIIIITAFVGENASVTAAFVLKGSSSGADAGRAEKLSEAELGNLSRQIAAKDYKAALGENYKLVVMKREVIEAAAQSGIISNGRNYTSPEAIEALEAGDGAVLKALVTKLTDNPALFIPHYKKGGVQIYPESQMFKVIRYVPLFGADALKGVIERLGRFAGITKNEA